jgi:hypothetical protein
MNARKGQDATDSRSRAAVGNFRSGSDADANVAQIAVQPDAATADSRILSKR